MEWYDKQTPKFINYIPWLDIKLNEEEMNFLKDTISEENLEDNRNELAGNLSMSKSLPDKNDWFYETVIKKLTKRLFYRNWSNYYKYHIEKEEPPPEFRLDTFWVNYQKQHEFNPAHEHSSLYSFVVFMKIPTHWKEQHNNPPSRASGAPQASDFAFILPNITGPELSTIVSSLHLGPEDEGRLLFFPSELKHLVYPFYGTEEERITISGNIKIGKLSQEKLDRRNTSNKMSRDARIEMLKQMEKVKQEHTENVEIYKRKFFPELLKENER